MTNFETPLIPKGNSSTGLLIGTILLIAVTSTLFYLTASSNKQENN
jgi:hypothetical protein